MRYRYQAGKTVHEISIERQGETILAAIDGQSYPLEVLGSQPGQISLLLGGKPVTVDWAVDGSTKWLSSGGCTYRLDRPTPARIHAVGDGSAGEAVHAPMPAQVRAVQVEEGEVVEKGATLVLLEAMKMEIRIKAPSSGRVKRLAVTEGQTVEKDQLLAEIGAE